MTHEGEPQVKQPLNRGIGAINPASEGGRDVEVLVIGAGPTGVMAACELIRRGVQVRLIDRAPEPSPFPKALLLWPRSLDLLADLGALDAARDAGLRINAFSYFSNRRLLTTCTFPESLAPLCLPQVDTERVLTERLHALGGRIERGVRLLALDGLDFSGNIRATDGVTAILEHADGRIERARAGYIIGADGAGSAVRGQLGTGFVGATYENAFGIVDAPIEGDLPPDQALYYQSPAGALVVVALPNGIYRFFSSLAPHERVSVELLQRHVNERGPSGVRIGDPVWQSVFRVHRRHALDFQLGRVFLAGDAAHVHSPAGGQGLNTGLQDAHNIAWKLAAVIHGEAPVELLATYEPERKAVAQRVVRDTDIQTRGWMLKKPAQVAARDAAFRFLGRSGALTRFYAPVMAGRRLAYPPVRETQLPSGRPSCRRYSRVPGALRVGAVFPRELAAAAGITGTAADPRQWTLVEVSAGPTTTRDAFATAVQPGWRIRTARIPIAKAARLTGCDERSYYLVRPDGHIAAHGHAGDRDRLVAELTAMLGPANKHAVNGRVLAA